MLGKYTYVNSGIIWRISGFCSIFAVGNQP